MDWSYTEQRYPGGTFRLYLTRLGRGGQSVDVSAFRGVPTQYDSYSSSDPFGDSTATFTFPGITVLDDLDSPDLASWLAYYANVDLWWIPSVPLTADYPASPPAIDPATQKPDILLPNDIYVGGVRTRWNRTKVWEGFVADMGFTEGDSSQLQIQCQGALFQVDRYLQKPFYPARPWPLEKLIQDTFSHVRKPNLRTQELSTVFPADWTKVVPPIPTERITTQKLVWSRGGVGRATAPHPVDVTTIIQAPNDYTPVALPGSQWTGLTSRSTGAWEHALTGFVQDTLSDMIVDNDSGATPGNQWTVQQERQSPTSAGRVPVLMVRDRFRPPDFTLRVGTPGVKVQVSGDSTQSENVIYGDGTDVNGQVWRNAVISNDGSRTDYVPLAAGRDVYPPVLSGPDANTDIFVSEAYTKFGPGFSQEQAVTVTEQQLARDRNPGWSGSITLSVDPSPLLPRWLVRSGMTVLLQGFLGSGNSGVPFHIASVEADPMSGDVTLTVDTRYRDLLTVAESQERARDPLNPVRMLQVNQTSVLIEDIQAPWDYNAGSGYIPQGSVEFYRTKPASLPYPQVAWTRQYPPLHFGGFYVSVAANAPTRAGRWKCFPILTAEKGTIARTEVFCVDAYGRPVLAPFHFSIYKTKVSPLDMPRDGQGPSPYIDGAFESVNPATGQVWDTGNFLAPNNMFIIGWGNRADGIYNRAGFSPSSEAEGGSPTGLLFDDATWNFDNTDNPDYQKYAAVGVKQPADALMLWGMFYCEWPTPVYFGGRLYRQNPGQG